MEDLKDFFISYNQTDKQWAKWVAGTLEQHGYSTIVQAWDFRKGENFIVEMQKALIKTRRFIAILSKDYLESLYCQAEWAAAYNKDPNSEKSIFIPVRVTNVEPEGLLSSIIYIDLFGSDEQEAEKRLLNGVDVNNIPRNRPGFPGKKKIRLPGTLPFNNLPYNRNEFFTGRDKIIKSIYMQFQHGNYSFLTQSVNGLGGIGKTQIALEYAYRYADNYNTIWWIEADTGLAILRDYHSLCYKLRLINNEIQDEEYIVETIRNWCDNHEKWLFIYDNVEETEILQRYLPKNNKGHILVTTRNTMIHIGKSINISVLTRKEACNFMEYRTGLNDLNGAKELSKRLGYLPLALEQAGAYIYENGIYYQEYVNLLEEYGLELFDENSYIIDYKLSVTITWDISINKLNSESAKQFLYLCSYLASDNINPDFFKHNIDLLPEPLKLCRNKLEWNQIIKDVNRYSLVSKSNNLLQMHRLVQEIIRDKIGENKDYIQTCLAIILNTYTYNYEDIETQNEFLQLSPHALSIADKASKVLKNNNEQGLIGFIYHTAGYGYLHMAAYDQSISLSYQSLDIRKKIFEKNSIEIAVTYNNIACVHTIQGNYRNALDLYYKILDIYENNTEDQCFDVATTFNNIASVYYNMSDYPNALIWFNKALKLFEMEFEINCLNLAFIYNNIAMIYSRQALGHDALELYQRALDIFRGKLGEDHTDTIMVYNNIAGVYDNLGEYAKALEGYQKYLDVNKKVFGENHPSTAIAYSNVASIYNKQEKYAEALKLHHKALAIRNKVFGYDHPDIASSYNDISKVYYNKSEYQSALKWLQKALAIYEKVLGHNHSEIALTINNIAVIYAYQGYFQKALELHHKALAIREEVFEPDHPDIADSYNNIAFVFDIQCDYHEALRWYYKALTIRERVFGSNHPDIAESYYNIATVFDKQRENAKALKWYYKALSIFEEKYPDNSLTQVIIENITNLKNRMQYK